MSGHVTLVSNHSVRITTGKRPIAGHLTYNHRVSQISSSSTWNLHKGAALCNVRDTSLRAVEKYISQLFLKRSFVAVKSCII